MGRIGREELFRLGGDFVNEAPGNRIGAEEALRPDLAGMRMYEEPLWGVARADDPIFAEFRNPGIIGPHHRLPGDWLPGAASVVSFFLPYAEPVIVSNRVDPKWPSPEWLHARIEGQEFIDGMSAFLVDALVRAGGRAVAPGIHPEFSVLRSGAGSLYPLSNWSERHVAFAAGLGTFGLSACLITERGAAGRFGSVITDIAFDVTPRLYTRYDEYCTHCGACARRCPVQAILPGENRKDKGACGVFLDVTEEKYRPRFGCGKCYVSVPCERGIPGGKVANA